MLFVRVLFSFVKWSPRAGFADSLMADGSRPFMFGVSQFTTMPWSFDEDVARYAALGVDAIEVVEAKLDEGRWAEQMAAIAGAGLRVSGVQPKVRTFLASRMMPEPRALDDRMALLRASIERLARFAPGAPVIGTYGPVQSTAFWS